MAYAKSNVALSLSEFAKLSRLNPRTVSVRLVSCPFEQKGAAHLYRLADALPLLCKGATAREKLAEAQTKLAELTLAERNKEVVRADDMLAYLAEFAWQAKSAMAEFPIPETARTPMLFALRRATTNARRHCGLDVASEDRELAKAEAQFKADVKAGRIPHEWGDISRPANHARVWDQEKRRYMSKREIISKFGASAQISPIDEILDEVAEAEADK